MAVGTETVPGAAVRPPPDRARRRLVRPVGLGVAVAALALTTLLSIAYGARPIPLGEVLDAFGAAPATDAEVIVRTVRVPRTVLGLLVGAALGLAGTVAQGLTRNPLADPGLLGVSAGAAFAVVLGTVTLDVVSVSGYVWFAFAGAAAASVLVYLLGGTARGRAPTVTLVLAGAALTALLAALTSALVLLDAQTLDQYRFWVTGSLAGRDAGVARQVAPFLAAGAVLALACARPLNALALGEDAARALGQRVGLVRLTAAAAVTLLTGAAVAACGPIAFVGLVVPHLARAVCGPDHRWLLPYSAVLAPVLLLGADVLGRVVARPDEIQVGIVTSFVGAPLLIALVRLRKVDAL